MDQLSMFENAQKQVLTMSSREIAELCGKEHKNVLADIRKMLDDLGLAAADFSATAFVDGPNNSKRVVQVLNLPKRETLVLVSGYSVALRAKIIDRWMELEADAKSSSFPVPQTYSQALRLAAEQAERIESQNRALAAAAPKVEFVDNYVNGTGLKGFRQVAKLLDANEHEFRAFLVERKIMYRLGGEWTAYDCHISAGRFQPKTGVADQTGHVFNQAKFTPKGVTWIAAEWAKHKMAQKVAAGEDL